MKEQLMAHPSRILFEFERPGTKLAGVFCGKPHIVAVHYDGQQIVECRQRECPACRQGLLPSFKILFNFYVPAEGAMRVIEGDGDCLEEVGHLIQKFGQERTVYEIECRSVRGIEPPRYFILPAGPLDLEQQKLMLSTPLYDLVRLAEDGDKDHELHTPQPVQSNRQEEDVQADLKGSLRFVHHMGMQTHILNFETRVKVAALTEELIANGHLDLVGFEKRRKLVEAREEKRFEEKVSVKLGENVDKYTLTDLPNVDCATRIPICKGRCCLLTFPLSPQDLDERSVEWDYSAPYAIRKGTDGYCVHSCPTTRRCLVYEHRPAICRTYSCREDERIWDDFERRISASDEAIGRTPYLSEDAFRGGGDPQVLLPKPDANAPMAGDPAARGEKS